MIFGQRAGNALVLREEEVGQLVEPVSGRGGDRPPRAPVGVYFVVQAQTGIPTSLLLLPSAVSLPSFLASVSSLYSLILTTTAIVAVTIIVSTILIIIVVITIAVVFNSIVSSVVIGIWHAC